MTTAALSYTTGLLVENVLFLSEATSKGGSKIPDALVDDFKLLVGSGTSGGTQTSSSISVLINALARHHGSDSCLLSLGKACFWRAAFTVPEGATGAILTNLLEQPQGSPLTITSNQLTVPIKPFEILTIRVDYQRAVPSTP